MMQMMGKGPMGNKMDEDSPMAGSGMEKSGE
jgi:hypothetical protein